MPIDAITKPSVENKTVPEQVSIEADLASLEVGKVKIVVCGLGGAGANAINRMIDLGLTGADFIAANTDRQALGFSNAQTKIQLGPRMTRGLGAGGDPEVGKLAAMESGKEIMAALKGADMVFVTAGMGGGTGTGSAPVVAEIARELGAVVIGIVTLPFTFEMGCRANNAMQGVKALRPHVHTLITVPNDRLLHVAPKDVSLEVAFRLADDVLRQGVQGITELVMRPGMINVDFAHVRQLMLNGGGALMAIGIGEGENKAQDAIYQALNHPLLVLDSLSQANGVLVHFTGGQDLTLFEVGEAITDLRQAISPDAEVILGATTDTAIGQRVQVILIVTGIGARAIRPAQSKSTATTKRGSPKEFDNLDRNDLDLPAFIRKRASIDTTY